MKQCLWGLSLMSCVVLAAESTPQQAAEDYYAALQSGNGMEILSTLNLDYRPGLKPKAELDLKWNRVQFARDYAVGSEKIKELAVDNLRYYHNNTVAEFEVRLKDAKDHESSEQLQAQLNNAGQWKIAFVRKPVPPLESDCQAVNSESRKGWGRIGKSDPGLYVKIPGKLFFTSPSDQVYAVGYPEADERVPQEDRKLWNHRASEYKNKRYQAEFEGNVKIIRQLEQAGYIRVQEGIIPFDYLDMSDKRSQASIAGYVYSFTDKARGTILKDQKKTNKGVDVELYLGDLGVKAYEVPEGQGDGEGRGVYKCILHQGLINRPEGITDELFAVYKSRMSVLERAEEDQILKLTRDQDGKWRSGF